MLGRFEPPAAGLRPAGVDDARWIHLGLEASKLAMADRDALPGRPGPGRHPSSGSSRTRTSRRRWRRASTPSRATPAPEARVPRGGGTIWLGVVDGDGNAVSLIESNYMGFGSGVVDPATASATRTAARSSASTRTTPTCSRRASGRSTR